MVLRHVEARVDGDERIDARNPRIRLHLLHPVVEEGDVLWARGWTFGADGNAHRSERSLTERVGQRVERLAARHAFREDAPVRCVEAHAKPRGPKGNEQGKRRKSHGERSTHHGACEARPRSLLVHSTAAELANGEAVYAAPEEAEQGGHQRDARRYGNRDGYRAGNADAAQDCKVEEGEPRQAEHHRHTREEDGATRRRHRSLHRIPNGRAATELFTEARNEQQRVVHAQAEPEQCGEVQDEDAHARRLRNAEDCGERNDHRCTTNGKWKSRRNCGTEHQQQDDRRQRKADQLAALKIRLRDTLNICVKRRSTSDRNLDPCHLFDGGLNTFQCRW